WKRGATDYRVSAIPLGGYVRMAGQDPSEVDAAREQTPTGAADELMSKPRWQRAFIAFAGPAVNLIFPIILLVGYFVAIGVPYPAWEDHPVQITAVPKDSPAAAAGLQSGEKVVAINGAPVSSWEQADKILSKVVPNTKLSVEVENASGRRTIEIPVQAKDAERPDRLLGFAPVKPVIDDVALGMPAKRAGLREGDLVRTVGGQPIEWWGEFTDRVRGSNGKPIALEVERRGEVVHTVVTPEAASGEHGDTIYQIGVLVHYDAAYRRVAFPEAVRHA